MKKPHPNIYELMSSRESRQPEVIYQQLDIYAKNFRSWHFGKLRFWELTFQELTFWGLTFRGLTFWELTFWELTFWEEPNLISPPWWVCCTWDFFLFFTPSFHAVCVSLHTVTSPIIQLNFVQWNLIITVTLGPSLTGCYIEVAFLLSGIQNHYN